MSTRRRGWTYSLRTLLLVVTAAALYLGSQLQTVAARREALRELEEKTATIEYGFVNHKYGGPWPDARLEAAERRVPGFSPPWLDGGSGGRLYRTALEVSRS